MSRFFEQWLQDARVAARGLRRRPGFTLVSVATLALGIGANGALFSVVNAVLLTPLPYDRPWELVVVGGGRSDVEPTDLRASGPEYADLIEGTSSLQSLGAAYVIDANITNGEQPEHVTAALVTTGFFSMLHAAPALGRDFAAEDAGVDIGYVMILSHGAWQRMFGGDPSAIGSTVHLDEDPFTVVGVMPEGFGHPGQPSTSPVEVWIPFDPTSALFGNRRYRPLDVYGRLAEEHSIDQAREELHALGDGFREADPGAYPADGDWNIGVVPLMDRVVGGVRPTLFILFGSVAFVLLVACTNVASLVLTRGSTRVRELATRAALGAGRGRLAVQMFTESLVLAMAGGALGLMLASVGTGALQAFAATDFPRIQEATVDGPVVLFTLVTAVTASVLFGLAPMWQLSKPDVRVALAEGARGSSGGGSRVRDAMVIGQISVSLILVISAGLMVKSFGRLLDVPLGFDADRVLAMQVWLPRPNVPETGRYFHSMQRISLFENALAEMETVPGVERAGVVSHLPLRATASTRFELSDLERSEARVAEIRVVSPGYFEVMGISVERGRIFESTDDTTAAPVVVVNEALADLSAAGSDPLGRTLRVGGDESAREVVGVVSDVRQHALDVVPRPTIYMPYRQGVGRAMTFVLRTSDAPELMVQSVTRALQRIDPDLPVHGVASMRDVVAETVAQRRTLMLLLSLFAVLSLLLAVLGVYGVIGYAARQRFREVAVRRALGAGRSKVMALFLRKAVVLGIVGIGIGIAGAAVSTRALQSFLFEVGRLDPLVLGAATLIWMTSVLCAALVPARRAAHVDPGEALRNE